MSKKIGLVLSGGAVRGLAHIGVLKALEEKGIMPSFISGVSAGAVVATFYSAGYSPDQMIDLVKNINFLSFVQPNIPIKSFFKIKGFEEYIKKHIKFERAEQLPIPTYIGTTNLTTGNPEYFNEGEISKLLRMSISVPSLFEPVAYNGNIYVDGGIVNNLPVEPILEQSDFIIGIDVNPYPLDKSINNIVSISIHSLFLAFRSNIEVRKKMCDLFIQPPQLEQVGLYSFWKAEEAIRIGYEYTKNLDLRII